MANTSVTLTPAQIAALPPQEQAQHMRNLSPAQQQLVQQENQRNLVTANRRFMRNAIEHDAYMPVTGGSGSTAAYTAGSTLYFDFPKVPGYATAILISYTLSVTPASGTSATYALNAAAPWNIFNEVQVLYNGTQVRTHPYFLKVLDQLEGFMRPAQNAVLAGNADSTITGQINGSNPLTVGSANTWTGKMLLRLNALGPDTVPGILPISGVGNSPQLKLTCTPNFIGQDPLLNPISLSLAPVMQQPLQERLVQTSYSMMASHWITTRPYPLRGNMSPRCNTIGILRSLPLVPIPCSLKLSQQSSNTGMLSAS